MVAEYHESYWVAISTAAPVVFIGYIISFERFIRYFWGYLQRRRANPTTGVLVLLDGVLSVIGASILTIGFLAPLSAMSIALQSLAAGKDTDLESLSFPWQALVFGLIGLVVATIISVILGLREDGSTRGKHAAPVTDDE